MKHASISHARPLEGTARTRCVKIACDPAKESGIFGKSARTYPGVRKKEEESIEMRSPPNGNEKERAREVGRGRLNTRRDARAPSVRR